MVSSLTDIEEDVIAVGQNLCSILNSDVLHGNIGSRSFDLSGNLNILGIGFGPLGVAAFQGVDLAHVVAQSRQDIGGSLGVALAGVADDDDVLVQIAGSNLHGGNTGIEVAFLGGIHVVALCTGDVGSLVVNSLTDIEEDVIAVGQNLCSFFNSDVLHSDIFCRCNNSGGGGSCRFGCLGATCGDGQNHQNAQQQSNNSLHNFLQNINLWDQIPQPEESYHHFVIFSTFVVYIQAIRLNAFDLSVFPI